MDKKITFIHLWNNFSGSPNVLRTVVDGLSEKGYTTSLITSFNNDGFLSESKCNNKINISYTFKSNMVSRLVQFVRFQWISAFKIFRLKKDEIVYINTIQPFLPAIAAKIRGMKVVYHIHEAYPQPGFFQKFLFSIAENTSSAIFCVSKYVMSQLSPQGKSKSTVIYNSLNDTFVKNLYPRKKRARKTVLMISSGRVYKGIYEFCELATKLPEYDFTLICDVSEKEVHSLFAAYREISNLTILPTKKDLHSFYSEADLIVNLSNPQLIIETFGLTILEGMAYGLPAIVPPVGGIAELVDDEKNGLKIDVNDTEKLLQGIKNIFSNEEVYNNMSRNAFEKSKDFNKENQISSIIKIIEKL